MKNLSLELSSWQWVAKLWAVITYEDKQLYI